MFWWRVRVYLQKYEEILRKKLVNNPHGSRKFQNGHEKNILTIIPYKTNLAHKFYATLGNFQTIPKNFKTVSEKKYSHQNPLQT